MYSIIVFGGQGRTGQEVVTQALAAGHSVTAFTYRNNNSLAKHKNLRIIEGNARNSDDINNAVKNHDIVINIIAPRLGDKKNYDISVVATKNIVAAMRKNGIKRYFSQCGAWATEDMQDASIVMRFAFWFFVPLKQIYAYKKQEDAIVKHSGLQYTIVRAARLTNGPLRWPVRSFIQGYKCKFYEIPHVSRKSVAKYYIENLDNTELIGMCPVVLN